jgi:hypothetical protein
VFPILLDVRGSYRKRTQLPGRYTKLATALSGAILIANLSFTGVGFVTKTPHPLLEVGDLIELRFRLDDPQASSLCKRAVVKHVHGRAIGAAFYHLNAYETELGFYLMTPTAELEL